METESIAPQATNPNTDSEQEARRSRSKISHLPSEVRDRIDELLFEGLTYARILEELGESGKSLNEMDLSRWMHGAHNLWLERRVWLDHMETSYDAAKDIVSSNKAASIHEANLHLVATQMCRSMLGCDPARLPELVKEDPQIPERSPGHPEICASGAQYSEIQGRLCPGAGGTSKAARSKAGTQ